MNCTKLKYKTRLSVLEHSDLVIQYLNAVKQNKPNPCPDLLPAAVGDLVPTNSFAQLSRKKSNSLRKVK